MTLSELKSRANELFSSILVFCPDFPAKAQTTTAKKFEQLNGIVDAVMEKIRTERGKQYLRICLQEIAESRQHYEAGNRKMGRDLIQRAEDHFKSAFVTKHAEPRFVVGESGAAQDTDAGFPA